MQSGYRRYDRYFMAYRETGIPSTGKTLFNNKSVLSCVIVWVLEELKLTRVSYSSVLLSDSSDFPYCPQKTWKSQHRWEKYLVSHFSHIQIMSFCPHTQFKAPHLEYGFASFPENLDLKGFLHFPNLENKNPPQKPTSVYCGILSANQKWNRCLHTSMMEPTPAGMRTSRLVCSSNKYRKITMVLKHLQSTVGPGTHRSGGVMYTLGVGVGVQEGRCSPALLDIPTMLFFCFQKLMSFLKARKSKRSWKTSNELWPVYLSIRQT